MGYGGRMMLTDRLSAEIDTQPAGDLRDLLKLSLNTKIKDDSDITELQNLCSQKDRMLEEAYQMIEKGNRKETDLLKIIIKKNFIIKYLGGEV